MREDRIDQAEGVALDHVIGEQPFRQSVIIGFTEIAVHDVAFAGGRTLHLIDPQHLRAAHDLLGHRIGDAGTQRRFDHARVMIGPQKTNDPIAADTPPFTGLRDGVTEQFGCQPTLIGGRQCSLDEE